MPTRNNYIARRLRFRDTEDAASIHNLALVQVALRRNRDAAALYRRMLAMPVKDLGSAPKEYSDLVRDMKTTAK